VTRKPHIVEDANVRLRSIAEELESHGWAAEILDHRWRIMWASSNLLTLLGESDPKLAGVGEHFLRRIARNLADGMVTAEGAEKWIRTNGPFFLDTIRGEDNALAEMLDAECARILNDCVPRPAPSIWTSELDFVRGEFFGLFSYMGTRINNDDGVLIGYLFLYNLDVPAAIGALLMRGDRALHERMAALVQPARRSAAVLFADLEGSTRLSRRLPGPVYFRLIGNIRTALDNAVTGHGGIVGKHAGDGVIGYFLSEQIGSGSRAARAALETALRLPQLAYEAAAELADDGLPVVPDSCRLKIAVHWGPNLYVGQIASKGRLEITALGDEMNEAARIEQSASGDQVLASKALIERLDIEDAAKVGLDVSRVHYQFLSEVEGVTEKARRDAGGLPVADIRRQLS
jgi:class 3 adenylate cyclase